MATSNTKSIFFLTASSTNWLRLIKIVFLKKRFEDESREAYSRFRSACLHALNKRAVLLKFPFLSFWMWNRLCP